jgi:hypothetical protein
VLLQAVTDASGRSPEVEEATMATTQQRRAAGQNVTKAREAATSERNIARRKRTGGDSPKTKAELYEIAKRRDLPGRKLGEK